MRWTKQHSRNAVAAKARQRMAALEIPEAANRARLRRLRGKAKWRLQLRDLEHGDSLTLTLHRLPWPGRYVDSDHREHSARSLALFVRQLLLHAP